MHRIEDAKSSLMPTKKLATIKDHFLCLHERIRDYDLLYDEVYFVDEEYDLDGQKNLDRCENCASTLILLK